METWDDEIVLVQGQIFETVITIKEGRTNVRLRLSYNSDSRKLQIFNANGSLLVEAEDVHVPVQTQANVSIRNRGENLQINSMVIYKGSKKNSQKPVDSSKPRVLMNDGSVNYGQLFLANKKAFINRGGKKVEDVDLSQVDRIFNPNLQLEKAIEAPNLMEL